MQDKEFGRLRAVRFGNAGWDGGEERAGEDAQGARSVRGRAGRTEPRECGGMGEVPARGSLGCVQWSRDGQGSGEFLDLIIGKIGRGSH